MHDVCRVGSAMLMLTVLVTFIACGPKSKPVKGFTFSGDISGVASILELDESQAPTLVYKRPGPPGSRAWR